jgi:DivIVA domain-containing protein
MAEAPKPPARRRRPRQRSAVERVRKTDFPIVLRGYDREAVDRYVAEVAQLVAELEATQTREGVVQRALDEVGEQTSGILQHAHDTAEEIAARSRSQAEGRLQRAEQEAAETRAEADHYAQQVVNDTRRLWDDRQRLIEDMRQLADEVLGTADDALERLELPKLSVGDPESEVGGEGVIAEEPPPTETTAVWSMPEQDEEPTTQDEAGSSNGAPEGEGEQSTSEFEAPASQKPGDAG